MCGICGIVSKREGILPSKDNIKRMIGSLLHRGPDSCGYFRDNRTALGHARLAIIDVEAGIQPLSNEDGRFWITFNGEIFNYIELRDELVSAGHVFRTHSDTETIIHAWEEWGTDCFCRFNGQWALAIWDRKEQTLLLSRDRLGIRPLYYTNTGSSFLFASEIKSLFADPDVERELDYYGLAQLYTFWSPLAPHSVFEKIHEIEPGYFAVLKNGKLRTASYWNLDFAEKGEVKNWNEALEEFRDILQSATQLRFERSDVPVGAYLSGGLDSSVTSRLVSRFALSHLQTYSLRFSDEEFDEGSFQIRMAKQLGTAHNSIEISPEEIGSIFPDVVYHAERPLLRTAPAPLFHLSRLVQDSGFKVVVTGEGADEVLAGYDIFREAKVRRIIGMTPDDPGNSELLGRLYPWMKRTPGKAPAFARLFFSRNLDLDDPALSHRPRWNTSSAITKLLSGDVKEKMAPFQVDRDFIKQLPDSHTRWDKLSLAQWFEYKSLLSGYILSAQGDRMLMANSVEGRFPFLDHRLVEFANRLPAEYKLRDLTEKYILKEAFRNEIPEEIISRPKQPYRAPDAESFFGGRPFDWLDEISDPSFLREAGIFNPAAAERLFNKCLLKQGKGMSNSDNMMSTAVISTMLTYKKFIKETPVIHTALPELSVFDMTGN